MEDFFQIIFSVDVKAGFFFHTPFEATFFSQRIEGQIFLSFFNFRVEVRFFWIFRVEARFFFLQHIKTKKCFQHTG